MNSIRSQLLVWLVPSFMIIALLAGSSLYLSEKLRLNASLDNELIELVRTMKLTLMRPPTRFPRPPGVEQDFASSTRSKLNDMNSGYYLQSWNEEGETIRRSLSLGKQQLPVPKEHNTDDIEFDSRLSSGDEVRVHTFTIKAGPRRGVIDVAVAISKRSIDQRLTTVALQLIGGGLFFCLLLSIILIFVIRKALIPIQNLSEQVAKVEVGSLHNRLIEKNIPREIAPLVDRLNQLLARLEQSFARERQFNSDLAHELRTPLAAIRTTSEVALKWPEQSSTEDFQYIADSSAQLQQTIDSLLLLARIENSGAETLLEKVNMAAIVEECLSLQSGLIEERGISIILHMNEVQNTLCDPRLLRIIISNLISNAIEYAPINTDVIIDGDQQGKILRVTNMAPNLIDEDLRTMFDRLWRKDTSRTGTQHVGLGLSIAHTAAQAISLNLTPELIEQRKLQMSIEYS